MPGYLIIHAKHFRDIYVTGAVRSAVSAGRALDFHITFDDAGCLHEYLFLLRSKGLCCFHVRTHLSKIAHAAQDHIHLGKGSCEADGPLGRMPVRMLTSEDLLRIF